jgi:hypothetical protein
MHPVPLPHHRTCGFPHTAVEQGGCQLPASAKSHGMMNPWWLSVLVFSADCILMPSGSNRRESPITCYHLLLAPKPAQAGDMPKVPKTW